MGDMLDGALILILLAVLIGGFLFLLNDLGFFQAKVSCKVMLTVDMIAHSKCKSLGDRWEVSSVGNVGGYDGDFTCWYYGYYHTEPTEDMEKVVFKVKDGVLQ